MAAKEEKSVPEKSDSKSLQSTDSFEDLTNFVDKK